MVRSFRSSRSFAGKRKLRLESLENRTLLAADVFLAVDAGAEMSSLSDLDAAGIEPVVEVIAEAATDVLGDFNLDGVVSARDLNVMMAVIRSGDQTDVFDIDGSGSVDSNDMHMLVHEVLETQYGDADLNGVVNRRDLASWQLNKFDQNGGWEAGDFNGDGFSDVRDFNVWNAYRGFGESLNPVSAGDFNADGDVDAEDINSLAQAIRSADAPMTYDLDSSGMIDKGDMDMLVHDVLETYYGDANLDGSVDVSDFRTWESNVFSTNVGWEAGDFDGNGVTDVLDFNVWNSTRGQGNDLHSAGALLVADFNNDGLTDAHDIDMLSDAINASSQNLMFDLTGDLVIDKSDRQFMVHDVLETRFADANLDGIIDSHDLNRWMVNRFQVGTGWATGDFNGDGSTDVSDYNLWNQLREDGFHAVVPASTGDVNADGMVNAQDIDAVHAAIQTGSTDAAFDLNGDGQVSRGDSEMLIFDVLETKYGDSNLDGVVDFDDHDVVMSHVFTADTGWSNGDFNGDGVTDVLDFNHWNYHRDVGFNNVESTGIAVGRFTDISAIDKVGESSMLRLRALDAVFAR